MKKIFFPGLISLFLAILSAAPLTAISLKPTKLTDQTLNLIERIQLGTIAERSVAIEEAGVTGCKPCYYTLVSMLKDESPKIRRATGMSLGLLRNASAISHIDKALQVETDESVKADMVRSLGFYRTKESATLVGNYLNSNSEKIRFAAAKVLTIVVEETMYDKIMGQLKTETSDAIKVMLLHAALKLKIKSDQVTELVRFFYSTDRFVRLYAARGAADLKLKEALLDLKKAVLLEPEVDVRDEFYRAFNETLYK